MRARRFPIAAVAVSALVTAGILAAAGAQASGSHAARTSHPRWRTAIEVPGTAKLNASGNADVASISCPSAGNCTAGGAYARGGTQAFVASMVRGTWRKAIEVPGSGGLEGSGGFAQINVVSCGSAGNCSAGGSFGNGARTAFGPMVVSERHGSWKKATEVPGMTGFAGFGFASVDAISCASPGNCAAGGSYAASAGVREPFVDSQHGGNWGKAVTVPGISKLNTEGVADVNAVSCPASGDCLAGGYYDISSGSQPYLVALHHATWGQAIQVKGLTALGATGGLVQSISCPAAGACVVGGQYMDSSGHDHAFVVTQRNGSWRNAIEVPGTAALATGGHAATYALSCASVGNCAAGGAYYNTSGRQAWIASERNGKWGKAVEVPGFAKLNSGQNGATFTVSCGHTGFCAAGGSYNASGNIEVFAVSERNGKWGKATEVPGLGKLNVRGDAAMNSMSCSGRSFCAAGGNYFDKNSHFQAFVADQK